MVYNAFQNFLLFKFQHIFIIVIIEKYIRKKNLIRQKTTFSKNETNSENLGYSTHRRNSAIRQLLHKLSILDDKELFCSLVLSLRAEFNSAQPKHFLASVIFGFFFNIKKKFLLQSIIKYTSPRNAMYIKILHFCILSMNLLRYRKVKILMESFFYIHRSFEILIIYKDIKRYIIKFNQVCQNYLMQ